MKLPAFQFYPGDWRKDPNLRRCSHAARGVWIDMLCLMFDCDERGYLVADGVPWTVEEIALAVGGRHEETLACIQELLGKKVAHLDERGAVYSKRLVRDEEKRGADANRKRRSRSCHASVTDGVTPKSEDEDENEVEEESESFLGGIGGTDEAGTGTTGRPDSGTKLSFGESKMVKLTADEHSKLTARFGQAQTEAYILKLENYIGSKGKKYRSHYFTILSWVDKDGAAKAADKPQPRPAGRSYDRDNRENAEKIAKWKREAEEEKKKGITAPRFEVPSGVLHA